MRRGFVTATIALLACACFSNQTGGSSVPASHFTEDVNGTQRTVDCTRLDRDLTQPPLAPYAILGSQSASTDEAFFVTVPATAAALRDPSLLGTYAMVPYSEFAPTSAQASQVFQLSVKLVDAQGTDWYSCAASCGPASATSEHVVTSITEESAGAGTATFRISGRFLVPVTSVKATPPTTISASGDWSLRVTVPDPGVAADAGAD